MSCHGKYRLRIKGPFAIMTLEPDPNAMMKLIPLIIFPEGVTRKKKARFKFKNEMEFK